MADEEDILTQLRNVLVLAEKQSYDLESQRRRSEQESSRISRLESDCQNKHLTLEQNEKKLVELQLFCNHQTEHLSKFQKSLTEERNAKAGYESALESCTKSIQELESGLKKEQKKSSYFKEKWEVLCEAKLSSEEAHSRAEFANNEYREFAENEISKLRNTIEQFEERCSDFTTKTKELEQNLLLLKGELSEEIKRGKSLGKRNDVLMNEFTKLTTSEKAVQESLNQLQERCSTAETDLNIQRKACFEYEESIELLRTEAAELVSQKRHVEQEHTSEKESLEIQLRQIKSSKTALVAELESQISQLNQDINDLKAAQSDQVEEAQISHDKLVRIFESQLETATKLAEDKKEAIGLLCNELEQCKETNAEVSKQLKLAEKNTKIFKIQNERNIQEYQTRIKELTSGFQSATEAQSKSNELQESLEHQVSESLKEMERLQSSNMKLKKENTELSSKMEKETHQTKTEIDKLNMLNKKERQTCLDLHKSLEDHKHQWEAKFREFEANLSKEKSLKESESKRLRVKLQNVESDLDLKLKELHALERSNEAVVKDHNEGLKQIASMELIIAHKTSDQQITSKELSELKPKIELLTREMESTNKEYVRNMQGQAKMFQEQLHSLTSRLETEQQNAKVLMQKNTSLQREFEKQEEISAGQILGFSERSRSMQRDRDNLGDSVSQLQSQLKLENQKSRALLSTAEDLRKELEKLKKENLEKLAAKEAEIHDISKIKAETEMELFKLKQSFDTEKRVMLNHGQVEREELHNAMEGIRWKSDSMSKELEALKVEQFSNQERINRLQRENADLKENEANLMNLYQRVVKHSDSVLLKPVRKLTSLQDTPNDSDDNRVEGVFRPAPKNIVAKKKLRPVSGQKQSAR